MIQFSMKIICLYDKNTHIGYEHNMLAGCVYADMVRYV